MAFARLPSSRELLPRRGGNEGGWGYPLGLRQPPTYRSEASSGFLAPPEPQWQPYPAQDSGGFPASCFTVAANRGTLPPAGTSPAPGDGAVGALRKATARPTPPAQRGAFPPSPRIYCFCAEIASAGRRGLPRGVLTAEQQPEELRVWQLRCSGEPEVPPVAPFLAAANPLGKAPPLENPKRANTGDPPRSGSAARASLPPAPPQGPSGGRPGRCSPPGTRCHGGSRQHRVPVLVTRAAGWDGLAPSHLGCDRGPACPGYGESGR